MRLLHCGSGEIREFLSEDEIVPYAILSHTWGDDEIRLQDWEGVDAARVAAKAGYRKITYVCKQAVKDGLEWVWIDT